MNTIFEDTRPIAAICRSDAPQDLYTQSGPKVGKRGVTKIEAYKEYGWCGYLPWLIIWKGEHLHMRTAAQGWDIIYQEEGE